ncbi:retrovirus-related pol polyprotein from transposon TNT 1-94 [Tanacetum coccineum]
MAVVEVSQTLEYKGGQLNAAPILETADERKADNLDQRLKSLIIFVLPDDQMNSVINCLTAKSTWDELILYHEGPSDVIETLMTELVNDGIKLSKLEINTSFINGLPKMWLSFCQSLRNTNHVKDSELASLFGNSNMKIMMMSAKKSYLHKYVEQPGPKVVFGDDSTCTTKGYASIKCNGIVFTKVAFVDGLKYNLISISQLCDVKYIVQSDEKKGTIFNSNKEVVMIAPRVRDVYVLDMTSSAQESCLFAKASKNLNWLWHKRLAHLNFKTINKVAKKSCYCSSLTSLLKR